MDDDAVPTRKRIFLCNSTADIISSLPRTIRYHILICLPIRDAARTSVLSKKWRFKWHYIPQLVLDSNEFFLGGLSKSPMQVWFQIYQVLALHRGTLNKFALSINKQMEAETYVINQIILILTGKDIHEFTLNSSSRLPCCKLFSTLFDCVQLRHLNLSACVIIPPPEFIGFSYLISVEFHKVKLSGKDFKTFISKCPLLQRLTLDDIFGISLIDVQQPIEIDAPNLKFLNFDCGNRFILFRNAPLLSTVIIKGYAYMAFTEETSSVVEAFCSLPAIEYFYASVRFIESFTEGVIPESLPITLNCLTTLELLLYFDGLEFIQCALLLIKSSPNLQKLTMMMLTLNWDLDDGEDYRPITQFYKDECLIEYSFSQLEEVKLKCFRGTRVQLDFLKFLLVKSLVLKRVTLELSEVIWDYPEEIIKILKEMNQLRRASPEAEIIFLPQGN